MALGIGILGTGGIATRALAPAVNAVEDAHLTAVLSRDRCRGAAFAQRFGIPEVHDNLDALLHSPNVQAVIVATPDASHEPQVIAAAQAGVHVLCEKPMTTTYAGCQRMAEAVCASGITFAMGYSLRFSAGLQRIEELLRAGRIGPVRYARALWTTLMPHGPFNWRAQSEQARYWALSAVGTHLVDLWRWYFGDPASVSGTLVAPVYQGPNDEVSILVLNYPSRLLAELAVVSLFRRANRLELHGENGDILAENLFGNLLDGQWIICNGEAVPYEPTDMFVAEVSDFVQAVEQGRPPRVALEDGMRNVRLLETAREAQRQILL
ncbi:Glucose--fructose oxidoreductase [Candidatus Entotheonellaceae bacterium PAL068K]